jgi:hypothetical protein
MEINMTENKKTNREEITFIISETFQTTTEESAENGDFEETGFNFENDEYSLDELETYLSHEGFFELSDSSKYIGRHVWIDSSPAQDRAFFEKGESTTKSLHLKNIVDAKGNQLSEEQQDKIWRYVLNKHLNLRKDSKVDLTEQDPFEPEM